MSLFRPAPGCGVRCHWFIAGCHWFGPLNTKLAHYASLWALSVVITVLIAVPLLPVDSTQAQDIELKTNVLRAIGDGCAHLMANKSAPPAILGVAALLLIGGFYLSSQVTIGEAEPGSPILYQNHDYNISSKLINDRFPGSEELYIVAEHAENGGFKASGSAGGAGGPGAAHDEGSRKWGR